MNKSTLNPTRIPNRSVALGAVGKITAAVKGWHLALAAIIAITTTVAVATPPSGIISGPVHARASFVDPTDIKFKIRGARGQEVIQVNNAQDMVIQQIIIGPGGHAGWHSHPGPVVVLIKSGTMSFYDSEDPTCTVRYYTAGQAFVDSGQGHVHIARNEGNQNLELWATYFDVPPGGAFRIDAPNPGGCSAKPVNISARGVVQTGDGVLIGGFILRGANAGRVIVRAIGPSLPVAGKLDDPSLELFDRNGTSIALNNNWRDTQEPEITATGIPPSHERESAIVQTLAPGAYTAIVRGVNQTTGVALVEIFALP
ncbi:hypothetical protein BH20VER1_BH20VER1_07340 [soil metagenome]